MASPNPSPFDEEANFIPLQVNFIINEFDEFIIDDTFDVEFMADPNPYVEESSSTVFSNPWILNQPTGSIEILDVESSSRPASRASIESLTRVKVSDPGLECSICYSEYEGESEAKKMPCGHLFHSGCIDQWLGINGSCPLCRFRLPVEERESEGFNEGSYWLEWDRLRGFREGFRGQ